MTSVVTFRDYAAALMQGNKPGAIGMLEQLLGLPTPEATAATDVFAEKVKDPAFLPKAMGLRQAVESGSDDDIFRVLVDCFALTEAQRAPVIAAVRQRYPAKS